MNTLSGLFRRAGGCGIVLCLFLGTAWAGPVGGLSAPLQAKGFSVSGWFAYGERDVEDGSGDEVSTRRMLARIGAGVADGIDVYALVGFSDAQFDDADFSGTLGPSLGLGFRYGLLHYPRTGVRLVLDVQGEVFRSRDGSKTVRHQAYHAAVYVVREIGAAGRVGYLYPYGGARVSYTRYDGSGGVDDYTGDDFIGVFGGADYFVNPNVFFTGEVHLFDETSIYLGVGYRF